MTTTRKGPPKSTPPKATPAGRKTRKTATAPTAGAPKSEAAAPSHLRAVETAAPVAPAIPKDAAPKAGGDAAEDGRFKRPDLIEAVAEQTAMKRADAKVVLELVLQELGRALDTNEELVLPPLGKLMVKKRKPDADGPDILTVKIRRPRDGAGDGRESPLADPGEDS